MNDAPYFKPHETGPIFLDPEEVNGLTDDIDTLLVCSDRDVEAAVAVQNCKDLAETSFKLWVAEKLAEFDDK